MIREYRRRVRTCVAAVQLDLEFDGFTYRKWGSEQRAKRGDWLVNNDGEVYTIELSTFERTYRNVGPGVYEKVANVWAEPADQAGTIPTKEGSTDYAAGDFLVYNDRERRDGYAMTAERFHSLYEPV